MTGPARLLSLALLLVACAPRRDTPVEQIPQLPSLEQVMQVQATVADPQFKKIGAASYTEADFAAFLDTGERIQATTKKLPDFSKGPGFDALAVRLGQQASALSSAASAKDATAAREALRGMKAVCKECHQQFR